MVPKQDMLSLLAEIKETNPEASSYMSSLYTKDFDAIKTLKFITTNDTRPLELSSFFEKLRKSYNDKKSKLYINIVKEDRDDLSEILTTLSSYILQVLLFSKSVDDKEMFLRSSRVQEATEVLTNYFDTYDIEDCKIVLDRIKADIKVFEYLKQLN